MHFNGRKLNKTDYCQCNKHSSLTSYPNDLGYWDICCDCGKPIENGFHYYDHYDGEDHIDIDEL